MSKTLEKKKPNIDIFEKWIMFTAAITGMAILSAFYPVWGNIPLIVLPSIFVLVFSKPVFFEKMKLTTLVTMRIVTVFAALRFFNPEAYVDMILLALIVNILEATFTDLLKAKKICNAISGFALAAAVATLDGHWFVEGALIEGTDYYTVTGVKVAVTICFILAYTLWNWIFVSNEFSDSVALMHVGFLSAPIIGSICTLGLGSFGGFGMWLLLRANSLAIGGWLQIGAKDWFEVQYADSKFSKFVAWTKKPSSQVVFMIINLALIAACFIITFQNGGLHYELPEFFANSRFA